LRNAIYINLINGIVGIEAKCEAKRIVKVITLSAEVKTWEVKLLFIKKEFITGMLTRSTKGNPGVVLEIEVGQTTHDGGWNVIHRIYRDLPVLIRIPGIADT